MVYKEVVYSYNFNTQKGQLGTHHKRTVKKNERTMNKNLVSVKKDFVLVKGYYSIFAMNPFTLILF